MGTNTEEPFRRSDIGECHRDRIKRAVTVLNLDKESPGKKS
jgi:hypothetical protein